jgi:hypothetical protein
MDPLVVSKKRKHERGLEQEEEEEVSSSEEEEEDYDSDNSTHTTTTNIGPPNSKKKMTGPAQIQSFFEDPDHFMLNPFCPHTVPPDFAGSVLGKCGTGKSFWLRWFLYAVQFRYARTWVCTGTKFNKFYQSFVPSGNIMDGYDDIRIGQIIALGKKIKDFEEQYNVDLNYRQLIILDDVFKDSTAIRNSKFLKELYTVHRHLKISIISLLQTKVGINKYQREQSAFVTIFKTPSVEAKDGLFRDYGDILGKREFFTLIDKKAVGKFALVARPARNSNLLMKAYESSFAEEVPDFMMPDDPVPITL